jgi:hypothetical protein
MSLPRDTHDALSDITNITGIFLIIEMYATLLTIAYWFPNIYVQMPTLDEAARKREERNQQQRRRQALCWFIKGVSRSTTRILAKPKEELNPTGKSIKNIVYKDVLNWWITVGILKPFYQSSCEHILLGWNLIFFGHIAVVLAPGLVTVTDWVLTTPAPRAPWSWRGSFGLRSSRCLSLEAWCRTAGNVGTEIVAAAARR